MSSLRQVLVRFKYLSKPQIISNHVKTLSKNFHTNYNRSSPLVGLPRKLIEDASKRYKYTQKTKDKDDLSDSDDDEVDDKDSKVLVRNMTSLRADNIIKTGLGVSRNKVEAMFYESRIRVNGHKISKKSHKVDVGDEVDLVKGLSPMNEDFLNVSRVVVLSCKPDDDDDGLRVKMRRFKTLMVENYTDDPWKKSE